MHGFFLEFKKRVTNFIGKTLKQIYYMNTYFQVLFIFFILMITSKLLFLAFHVSLAQNITIPDVVHSLFFGLKFDLAAAGICSLVGIFIIFIFHRYLKIHDKLAIVGTLGVTVFIALFILIADSIYFEEAQRHLGYEVGNFLTDPVALMNFIFSRYWFLIFIYAVVFSTLLFYSYKKIQPKVYKPQTKSEFPRYLVFPEVQFFIVAVISVILIRGGLQAFPLEPIHANHLGNSNKASIALNGLYNAVYYSFKPNAQNFSTNPENFSQNTLKQILLDMYKEDSNKKENFDIQKYNVVIIFLESWDAYHMKSYGNPENITPNFDALRKQSLTTSYMFSGGTRTSEGMFATLCSYPNPLGQAIVKTTLEEHRYICLPEILANYGYRNYFFQGTSENLARTGDFARKLGFHESYGQEDIKNPKFTKNWFGVHDADLYDFIISKIQDLKEPFLLGINTGTTHDHRLPDGLPEKFSESKANVMNFADEAIPPFLEKFKKNREIFNRTIFVMLADHTSHSTVSNFKRYSIPFLIYAPGIVKAEKIPMVASQRDTSPTILDILHMPSPHFFAGKSLTRKKHKYHFAEYFSNGTMGWVDGNILIEMSLFSRDIPKCFDYEHDLDLQRPVECPPGSNHSIEKAKYFTYETQRLLFDGKTFQFKDQIK